MFSFDKLDFISRQVTLPEGEFYKVDTMAAGKVYTGLARNEEIAVALCLDKVSEAFRNAYYEKKRAGY